MSASNLNQPIFLVSFIIYSESASGRDALADSTAEADPRKYAPHDSIPQQQGRDKGTKNYTLNHIFAGTNPNVLVDKTKSVSEGLETILTTLETGKGADLESQKDDRIIVVNESEEKEDKDKGIHADSKFETKDTSVPKPLYPRSIQLKELTNQVLILQSQKRKLDLEKNKAEAEVAFLLAQPSFPNVTQLTELLVKSLKPEFLKILSTHDFSSSLPTELKELLSKFNELTEEVKGLKIHVHELEIELPGDLKDISPKLEEFTKTVTREKNTNQATISQLFQIKAAKDANLNKQQAILTPLITTTTTSTTSLQSPFISSPPKSSSQTEGERIKKAKKDMYLKDAEEGSDSKSDDIVNLTGSKVESSRNKELKKFDFITENGDHIHLTKEQIKTQKKIEESTKAEAAKHEVEVRKEELVDLLGPDVVSKYYKAKLQYDNYCDKMLNRRVKSRITNCDVLTRMGPITLKVYREDGTSKVILNFKASDLHLGEWREPIKACPNRKGKGWSTIYEQIQTKMDYLYKAKAKLGIDVDKPLNEQDLIDKLNDLANKKRKHANEIHDYFRANKRLKSSVLYEDHPDGTVLNEPGLGMIMFNSYHRHDFVTIKDFRDFTNEMLRTVQEIFIKVMALMIMPGPSVIFSLKWISDKRMKNQAKNDKIEHEMEKRGKAKVNKSQPNGQLQESPVKTRADTEE
ncbi:hypothetical protein Tco_0458426 [Tanacetum coccineum]